MKYILLHPLRYEERPRGHEPDHFADIDREMVNRGHENVTAVWDTVHFDVCLFDSDVWNVEGGTSPYSKPILSHVLLHKIPVVWWDHFDHCGDPNSFGRWPGTDDWKDMHTYGPLDKHDWCYFGWNISRPGANRLLYFMRKMQKSQPYPPWVVPLEYPLLDDYPIASYDEFWTRPNDVCGLANNSGPRAISMTGLYRNGRDLKLDMEIIPHYRRLDYKQEYIPRHRQARMFLEADASLGSERPLRLISVAAMLRIKSDQRIPFPFTDMENMVEIGDYDGRVTENDVAKLRSVLGDNQRLYKIYVAGAEHMRTHYSLSARSKYVVDKIEEFIA